MNQFAAPATHVLSLMTILVIVGAPIPHDADSLWLYADDKLGRLVDDERGQLNLDNTAIDQPETGGNFGEGEDNLLSFLLDPIPLPPIETFWTEREYVYGTGYVDEFVCEFSPSATAGQADDVLYFLQDANYNVVALTDATGAIAEQRVFEPYGELAAGETFCEHAVSRVGHQGLFFERLDGTVNQPPIAPAALGFYYNRNRMYSPTLGRFMQRDPNATALPIMTAMSSNGQAMDILLGGFNPSGLYGDGMNLYEYVGSNPVSGRDPSGLDDFDDLMGDLTGQRIATLGYIQEGSGFALLSMNLVVGAAGALLNIDLFQAGANILSGDAGLSDYLEAGAALAATATGAIIAYKAIKWYRKFKAARRFRKIIERHHLLPLEFADDFAKAGIRRLDDFVIDLDRARHRLKPNGIHTNAGGNWNRRWKQFFREFKGRN